MKSTRLPAVMFTLTEVTFLNDIHTRFQTLKPWWDVLMDYLVLLMLMVSLLSGTLLISVDHVICLPLNDKFNETTAGMSNSRAKGHAISDEFLAAKSDHSFSLDHQQYLYISHVCYQKALPWLSKYFPYLALVNSLLLMASSNFWFRYPKTSSKIEHFLSILRKCFESPWTTKALSEMACQHSLGLPKTMDPGSCQEQLISPSSSPILDWKDREQGWALFEKIHRFRAHTEGASLIYMVYMGQTIFKIAKVLTVLIYTSKCVGTISFKHVCCLDTKDLIGYSNFLCTHSLAFILQKLTVTYLFLVFLYGIVGAYPLLWLIQQPLRKYSFKHEGSHFLDIPDVYNDFAFLLHMADQCDQLYSRRFAIFLSAMSESCLLDISCDRELVQKSCSSMHNDTCSQVEMRLCKLQGFARGHLL
ncbi:volume-regulated anion channel subunit LRRC8D-like [Hemicordylus capensis]|uniref:volume-regulated anion channel subunit LRRC8D-like n=1 Tax=Hemicordylus capensis TaxID=884348 RepID=UPI0023023392|nr:volume-regulated anion channel subunit LRRC8D-like [Hemicordylus capensis]